MNNSDECNKSLDVQNAWGSFDVRKNELPADALQIINNAIDAERILVWKNPQLRFQLSDSCQVCVDTLNKGIQEVNKITLQQLIRLVRL